MSVNGLAMAATKAKPVSEPRRVRTVTLFLDEAFWASLAAKLGNQTIPELMSDLVRDELRKRVRAHNVDPDDAWKKYEAASRN